MKKRKVLAIFLSMALVLGAVGCGSKENPKEETPPKKEAVFTEKDIQDVIAGIEDHYVLQDAKGIDYLHNVSYDADIVEEVTVDSKDIKVEKPGTYQALYTVKVNKKALEDYLKEQKDAKKDLAGTADKDIEPDAQASENKDTQDVSTSEPTNTDTTSKEPETPEAPAPETEDEDKKAPDSSENQEDAAGKEDQKQETDQKNDKETEKVEIETDITVVDKEEAQDLANKGEVVWGDNNTTVPKEDGTVVEEEVAAPESNPTEAVKPEAEKPADTKPSGQASKPNGNSGSSGNKKPSHTHNYNIPITQTVKHDATGHYEKKWVQDSPAWDEPIYENRTICNGCGKDLSNMDAVAHSAECGSSYGNRPVQVGTKHHEAKGHYENKWVQDKAAWTETKTVGWKCSCGAKK